MANTKVGQIFSFRSFPRRRRRQRDRQKAIGLLSKTTTSHVHHAFLNISLRHFMTLPKREFILKVTFSLPSPSSMLKLHFDSRNRKLSATKEYRAVNIRLLAWWESIHFRCCFLILFLNHPAPPFKRRIIVIGLDFITCYCVRRRRTQSLL